ncbi:transporter substrate-binding domain-containing protein [Wielerella bovis]|uniref:substrate-binding periplasmic protein n=1 Tax=Wielerella bovis TaxID=2917790 RepID=UPI00201A05F8|nr:transporter substrate-binding domain-containing protein [Wielerella bovis]ULJ61216.1 transporter substrate-binding domain-containing protein [Wielerella bovis]ULJ70086.1 transporter substrate-binding domain-containing protein [Wielerella bovis]
MKKSILVAACLLALSACSNESQTSTSTQPTETPTSAVTSVSSQQESYIVGTDASYPPFDFKDEQGQIAGFDVDLLNAIAQNQGFSVSFVSQARSGLFDSLGSGEFQILAACLGMRPERLEKSEMSEPYAFAPNVIMGKEGGTAKTLTDLKDKKVGVQQGSHSQDSLKHAGVSNIVPFPSVYAAYTAFIRGEVDYVAGDAGVLSYHHSHHDTNAASATDIPKVYTSVYDPNEDVRIAFAVQKGNTELIGKINAGLKALKADGTYDKIYTKWFGDDNSLRAPEKK